MTSVIKVDQIQNVAGGTPTAADLGLNVSGSVLQVKQVTGTNSVTSTSGDWTSVAGTCSITPSSASSKILIQHRAGGLAETANSIGFRFKRNGTVVLENDRHVGYHNDTTWGTSEFDLIFLDTPSTTSQVDYTFEMKKSNSGGAIRHNDYDSTINTWVTILTEIAG